MSTDGGPGPLPGEIRTERLVLPLWSADEAADILAGRHRPHWHPDFPRPDDRDAATLFVLGSGWSSRHVVRGTTVLGSIGFFGPPAPAADGVLEAEVGYGLVAQAQGYGFASEALRGVLAATDAAGVRVRAAVAPENRASLKVLAGCGFTGLRGSNEDGHLVMVRPLPAVSA
ncbi:hypothetical protein I601_1396 [Nocardioides dokdonensis FR1436]|uniref:N-acetyltransferase domain-containing protein n=1 Tax=Nocardioides dokdonensis FR1436 TaxID=1300347 RepID=A0A1A9GK50_9ACTN|nr:GNAT family N-acetyltransferase [Nocardioides dokdonensis]ANH37835.1 hypothetical protein I601_1396 [Nocardioides dokdonensis FR1436]